MRIGVFPLWAGSQIGGIATYDSELLPALAAAAPEDYFHIYTAGPQTVRGNNITHHRLVPKSRWINVPISFPVASMFSKLDLVHVTHVPPPILPTRYVMTWHCVSTLRYPEFYPQGLNFRVNTLLKRGLNSARMIVCVSKGLRDIAEAELKIHPDRLAVAHHGVSRDFYPRGKRNAADRVRLAFGLHRPYLLFVGVMAPRKNLARTVQAFAVHRQETGSDATLVLVGRKWIAADVDAAIRQHHLEQHVIQLGHVDDAWLPDLYSGAEMLVFPSLWESFGLPVIESMACGTPVLTARGSCLPEIAADAALLVDPYSVEAIADGINRILTDSSLAANLRKKGLERAANFTWTRSARETLTAYRRAMAA